MQCQCGDPAQRRCGHSPARHHRRFERQRTTGSGLRGGEHAYAKREHGRQLWGRGSRRRSPASSCSTSRTRSTGFTQRRTGWECGGAALAPAQRTRSASGPGRRLRVSSRDGGDAGELPDSRSVRRHQLEGDVAVGSLTRRRERAGCSPRAGNGWGCLAGWRDRPAQPACAAAPGVVQAPCHPGTRKTRHNPLLVCSNGCSGRRIAVALGLAGWPEVRP